MNNSDDKNAVFSRTQQSIVFLQRELNQTLINSAMELNQALNNARKIEAQAIEARRHCEYLAVQVNVIPLTLIDARLNDSEIATVNTLSCDTHRTDGYKTLEKDMATAIKQEIIDLSEESQDEPAKLFVTPIMDLSDERQEAMSKKRKYSQLATASTIMPDNTLINKINYVTTPVEVSTQLASKEFEKYYPVDLRMHVLGFDIIQLKEIKKRYKLTVLIHIYRYAAHLLALQYTTKNICTILQQPKGDKLLKYISQDKNRNNKILLFMAKYAVDIEKLKQAFEYYTHQHLTDDYAIERVMYLLKKEISYYASYLALNDDSACRLSSLGYKKADIITWHSQEKEWKKNQALVINHPTPTLQQNEDGNDAVQYEQYPQEKDATLVSVLEGNDCSTVGFLPCSSESSLSMSFNSPFYGLDEQALVVFPLRINEDMFPYDFLSDFTLS